MLTTQDYSELLERLEPDALKRLRMRHALNRDDREDVLQNSLIDLVKAMQRGNITEPAALLNTILDRRAIDRVRANERRNLRETPVGDTASDDDRLLNMGAIIALPALGSDDHLFTVAFDQAVRNLPETLRDVFILTDLRGLTAQEASIELGLPRSTVIFRADSARKTIRKELN